MRDQRLTVAEWLLEAGAGRSAIHALGDLLGQEANELRRLAGGSALQGRTVYALVTLDDRRGAVVPLVPSPGRSRARDPELRAACDRALASARALLGAPNLPALRFELEEWLSTFGGSLGLPALLAFLGYYAPSRLPEQAVLATGRLLEGGAIGAVGGMDAKLTIAGSERGEKRLLTPESVRSIEDAVAMVFGTAALSPERHVLTLDETIERARVEPDRAAAIAELEALPIASLPESDQARVLLELGTLFRHAGESDRAAALHARAEELLDRQRRFIGADAAERYELEHRLSEMDAFRIEEAIDALSARLTLPFLNAHNEVRCRGMLAQALGMAGRHAEAVAVREANIELQQSSEALRAVLPGTYCYLALDSAKAGDPAGFERWARLLAASTPSGAETQWRFNAAAIARGLVALERYEEALAWLGDEQRIFGARVPAAIAVALRGLEPISSHPETSVLRAAVRAHRRLGRSHEVLALASCVPLPEEETKHLIAWLCALVHLEASIDQPDAVQARLTALHPEATRFYGLANLRGTALEQAIDRVWY